MANRVGTRTRGAQANGSKSGASLGAVKTTRFVHPLPYRPPYSMNQRNAVRGLRADGLVNWSGETTEDDAHASVGPAQLAGRQEPAHRVQASAVRIVGAQSISERRDLADQGADPIVERRHAQRDPGAQAVAPERDRRRSALRECAGGADRIDVPTRLHPGVDLTPRIAVARAVASVVERQDRETALAEALGIRDP